MSWLRVTSPWVKNTFGSFDTLVCGYKSAWLYLFGILCKDKWGDRETKVWADLRVAHVADTAEARGSHAPWLNVFKLSFSHTGHLVQVLYFDDVKFNVTFIVNGIAFKLSQYTFPSWIMQWLNGSKD